MTECKTACILIDLGVANSLLLYEENTDKETMKWYQSAIASLIWLDIYTC